jgi:hypothetical protein
MTAATGLETAAAVLEGRTAAPRAGRNSLGASASPIASTGTKSFRDGFETLIGSQIESQAALTTAASKVAESTDSSLKDAGQGAGRDAAANSVDFASQSDLVRAVFGQNGLASANASGQAGNLPAGQQASGAEASTLARQAQLSTQLAAKQLPVQSAESETSEQGVGGSSLSAKDSEAALASTKSSAKQKRSETDARADASTSQTAQTVVAPQLSANPVPVALPITPVTQMPKLTTFPSERGNPIAEPALPRQFSVTSAALPASRSAEAGATAGATRIDAAGASSATHAMQEENAAVAAESADAASSAGNGVGNSEPASKPVSGIALETNSSAYNAALNTAESVQNALQRAESQLDQNGNDRAAATGSVQPAAAAGAGSEMVRGTGGIPSTVQSSVQSAAGSMRSRNTVALRASQEADSIAAAPGEPASGSAHSTLVRDSAGLVGAPTAPSGGAVAAGANSARDTFAALDADPGQPAATWVHTSARQVEAGYQDPALGWVSVRADATASGLHASLVPASTEAAQSLGGHLTGLNSFLAEHHGSAVTASVAEPATRESFGGFNGQGSGQQGQQDNTARKEAGSGSTDSASRSPALAATGAVAAQAVPASVHSGRISVMA